MTSLRNWKQKYCQKGQLVPDIGDVVLIYEEKEPRKNWCLGNIVDLVPSKDNNVRGAKILVGKTKTIIERPINKLYPVELSCTNINEGQTEEIFDNTVEILNDKRFIRLRKPSRN